MRKRHILAVLLAACMIMESTPAAFAAETETSSANTVESEAEPAAEEADSDNAQDAARTDSEADNEAEASEEETADKPEEDAGKESVEGAEQPLEEENLTGAVQVMGVEPQADEELIKNQTDWEITDLQLRQEYGEIALVWAYDKSSTAGTVFDHCNLYRSETGNDDDYVLILETNESDGHYHYEDKNVERVAGQAVNKTYYYKVGAVYNRDIRDENNIYVGREKCESELRSISNEDAYYYESAYPFFLTDESDYIGAYVTDDEGKRLDSLTITEGVPQSLRLTLVKADGTDEQLSGQYYTDWHLCKRYYSGQEIHETYSEDFDQLGTDKVQIIPEMKLSEGTMNDLHVNVTALNGSAGDEDYYLVVKTNHSHLGWFTWQIPVHINKGDGTYTPPSEVDGLYITKEALCQAIRDAMVARENTVLYATGGYEWWNTSKDPSYLDLDFEDVFDFHREREGMKPYEGDYLNLAIGDANSIVYYGTWMKMEDSTLVYGSQYLKQYTITPSFITTKAQEEQVDQKIDRIIRQEGGALYNYQNASDYKKIKAAYDYVRNHVTYIGTPEPIYHTCYSALINGQATCQGYALLFYRLVRELGVPCRVLMGTDANAHTYNIVRLGNAWYYVDTNAGVLLKGTEDFKPATLQSQYRTTAFTKEYISKISSTSYAGGSAESKLKAVECLTDGEILALDNNLKAVAGRMKASYTIQGSQIKASGTVKYMEGCRNYLGYREGTSSSNGYFLALKLNVDGTEFTQDGKITVSYLDDKKERKAISCGQEDLIDGAMNLLVKITEDPKIKITVDYDTDVEYSSEFDVMQYDLDISGVKKESQIESSGSIKEVEKYGIGLSSPIIIKSDDGKSIDVSYEAVAYSDKVELPEKTATNGNYIALQLNVPESVKGTTMAETLKIETRTAQTLTPGWNTGANCFIGQEEGNSAIYFAMPVEQNFEKSFTIKWGGEDSRALVQTLRISVPEGSGLESRNESALLPGSIAFNGLTSTMYVGQSQNIHITFKKKYEADQIQVFYTSNAADVVTVNRITGEMKALKPGTAQITVSAVNSEGQIITKSAKVAVKELPALTNIKVDSVKDTNVTVSWKVNTTGQYTEVYAIPYKSDTFGTNNKGWKVVVENAMREAGMEAQILALMEETNQQTMLENLGNGFNTGNCVAVAVPAGKSSVELSGLQPETDYLFYVRNVSKTAASTVVFAGATSSKIKTKGLIFSKIQLQVTIPDDSAIVTTIENGNSVYTVTESERSDIVELSYKFLDGENNEISEALGFTNVKYNSTNKNIVQVQTPKNAPPSLKYGAQVGDARITVSGKDASGAVRESEPIIIRVVKAPSQLKAKTTTLMVGQSISVKELIGTDLKGAAEGMDLSQIDFASVLDVLIESGCFTVTYAEGNSQPQDPQNAIVTATALIGGKSGNKIDVTFAMIDGSSSAMAKIQVKDMAAATIGKITVKDTSAIIEFTPSSAVAETTESRYYTLCIKDKVTGVSKEIEAGEKSEASYTCTFTAPTTGKAWSCEIKGLSNNKAYEAVIRAHFKVGETDNVQASKAKAFTTKKQLLVSEGSIAVNYISLDELRANPNDVGSKIDYEAENGIQLENNGTYVFMAQVSNLARTLETDKLKWTISSGDKKSASIKASSSSFEMQLTTTKTGTFTVTATSTSTKEAIATFTVEVIPYQSGGTGNTDAGNQRTSQTMALLPEADLQGLFKSGKEDAA